MNPMTRAERTRGEAPRSVPWPLGDERDVVAADTTWGELQALHPVPGVRTLGELEVLELLAQGAILIDSRVPGSFGGLTIPGARNIPHDQALERRSELDPSEVNILFCNGPQCPQSPNALAELVAAGFPPEHLAYYRGGMHDWVSLAMPTQPA
jgi:rhodanese-related sulfurtransferase